jgi:hypothetical protein
MRHWKLQNWDWRRRLHDVSDRQLDAHDDERVDE